MHRVLATYLRQFTQQNTLGDLEEKDRFERLVNYLVVNTFFPDEFELEEVTTGEDDWGVDGAAVIIGNELVTSSDEAVALLQRVRHRQQVEVTYLFIQSKRSEGFDSGEILKFGSGVKRLFGSEEQPSDEVLREIDAIHEVVFDRLGKVDNGRPVVKLFFTTTGVWNQDSGLQSYADQIKEDLRATGLFHAVEFEPIDRERLIGFWQQSQAPVQATLNLQNSMPLPTIAGVEEAYLAVASAQKFVDDILTDSEGRMRSAVFEHNVRAYLGDENPVNSKIKEVILSPESHGRFSILNNGVTIVSPDVKNQANRLSVSDYQIVNGCQTSHVLFRNREHLSDSMYLPLKVVEAEDPEIVAQLVEATNSQTDVGQTQFVSIRPFVRKLQAYFDSFESSEEDQERRLYFERRTKQYAGHDIGKTRRFDIQRLARAFAAMFLGVPHLAARYPTQTFREKADELYQEDHREYAYYAAALALYRLELSLGNKYVPRSYQRYKWHLLMIVRYQLAGADMPALNSGRLDRYCENIVSALSIGGRSAAGPFLDAVKIIDKAGDVGRDRLKRQAYTDGIRKVLGVKRK